MKKILAFTFLFCSILSHCLALAPMTDENLMQAIKYGIASKQDNRSMSQFLEPWKISEKLLKNPYRQKETVVLYTPYLLAAIHARDKVDESRMPELPQIRSAVQEYDGITLIGTRINTPVLLREGEYSVKLLQGKTILIPYATNFLSWEMLEVPEEQPEIKADKPDDGKQLTVNEKANKDPVKMKKIAVLDYQFYFDNSQFAPNQPFTIEITDKYCGPRNFDINPAAIR